MSTEYEHRVVKRFATGPDGACTSRTHGLDGQVTGPGQPARDRLPAAGKVADRPPELVIALRIAPGLCLMGAAVRRFASVFARVHGCSAST